MDKLSLYKYLCPKPCLILRLEISGEIINWLIPNDKAIEKSVKRLAIELPGSTANEKDSEPHRKTSLIEKCDIKIKYFGKRKSTYFFLVKFAVHAVLYFQYFFFPHL